MNASVAGAAPWPGTTCERHLTSAAHRIHPPHRGLQRAQAAGGHIEFALHKGDLPR